jgi:hypothetical protein
VQERMGCFRATSRNLRRDIVIPAHQYGCGNWYNIVYFARMLRIVVLYQRERYRTRGILRMFTEMSGNGVGTGGRPIYPGRDQTDYTGPSSGSDEDPDYTLVTIPEMKSYWEEILNFNWPDIPGLNIVSRFWTAALNPETMAISGDIGTVDFCARD